MSDVRCTFPLATAAIILQCFLTCFVLCLCSFLLFQSMLPIIKKIIIVIHWQLLFNVFLMT